MPASQAEELVRSGLSAATPVPAQGA
jgi:hypothetical protein